MRDTSYAAVLSRKNEIMKASLGIDFDTYVSSPIAFDYERMMADTGFTLDDIARIQAETKVGSTPLHELTRLTEAVRAFAESGKGARILVKDEAANASGSFKARRASISAYEAKKRGYELSQTWSNRSTCRGTRAGACGSHSTGSISSRLA